MRIEHSDIIAAPLDKVFKIVRDELVRVSAYLPNVKEIKVLEYKTLKPGKTLIINKWYGRASMPALVQKFMSEELFSWKDTATWDDEKYEVDYFLESTVGKDIYDARGRNYFKAISPDKTEMTLTCEVIIYPEKIPGVPKLIAKKVQPVIEQMIEKIIESNLTTLGIGIKEYLKQMK